MVNLIQNLEFEIPRLGAVSSFFLNKAETSGLFILSIFIIFSVSSKISKFKPIEYFSIVSFSTIFSSLNNGLK